MTIRQVMSQQKYFSFTVVISNNDSRRRTRIRWPEGLLDNPETVRKKIMSLSSSTIRKLYTMWSMHFSNQSYSIAETLNGRSFDALLGPNTWTVRWKLGFWLEGGGPWPRTAVGFSIYVGLFGSMIYSLRSTTSLSAVFLSWSHDFIIDQVRYCSVINMHNRPYSHSCVNSIEEFQDICHHQPFGERVTGLGRNG